MGHNFRHLSDWFNVGSRLKSSAIIDHQRVSIAMGEPPKCMVYKGQSDEHVLFLGGTPILGTLHGYPGSIPNNLYHLNQCLFFCWNTWHEHEWREISSENGPDTRHEVGPARAALVDPLSCKWWIVVWRSPVVYGFVRKSCTPNLDALEIHVRSCIQ